MADLGALLSVYEQALTAVADLGDALGPDDWDRPTDLPGWSVKDNIAHVAGLEAALAGRPVPEHELPADLPHVKNDFARLMEVHVDLRRPVPGPEIVAELRSVIAERMAAVRAQVAAGATELPNPLGTMWPIERALQIRVFDVWCHEQDVRRAVGRSGGLDSTAAAVGRDRLASGLPRAVTGAGARPGQSVAFSVTGPTSLATTVTVEGDGRGAAHDGVEPAATTRLTMDFETFLRLGTGRVAGRAAPVTVEGDEELGRAVLANLAMTP